MIRLIRIELFKMSKRPRSYLGFAAFLVINILFMLGLKYGGLDREVMGSIGNGGGVSVIGSPVNAEFMTWMAGASPLAVPILTMFMPFFVCLIFGEIFAGENAEGTVRTVLSRPITRWEFFTAKFAASAIYAAGLVFFLGISAYIIGIIFFGRGGLLTTGSLDKLVITWYGEREGLARLALSYLLTFMGMMTVGMVAFFISAWLNNTMGAIGGAIMLLFAMFIVGAIPWFKPIKDYLFGTHLLVGTKVFLDPIPWPEISTSLICLGAYIAGLFIISMLIFSRKDVLA